MGNRSKVKKYVKRIIAEIDESQWDMCMSRKHSIFRSKLSHVKAIGRGSFGEIYSVKYPNATFVIKEAYLSPKEKQLMLKGVGRNDKAGQINKQSYPEEYRLLMLTQTLLKSIPNFLYIYDLAVCEGCTLQNKQPGTCYLTFMEFADGNLYSLFKKGLTDKVKLNILYQLLIAVDAIHSNYGIYHQDIKLENILFKRYQCGGYFEYNIRGDTFHIENLGILVLLSDFGVAISLLPMYSGPIPFYGTRNAMVKNSKLIPIKCKYGLIVDSDGPHLISSQIMLWDNGSSIGTNNQFYENYSNLQSDIPIDLNDPILFPPFEFFNDIQDTIRMFIGGKRTRQVGTHGTMKFTDKTIAEKITSICFANHFQYYTDNTRFIVAIEMLKTLLKG